MISKAEKNYYINIPLTIIGVACLISGFLLQNKSTLLGGINIRNLHVWTGYLLTVLIGLHFVMHLKWIKTMTSGIFQNRLKVISLVTAVLVSLGICYASGSIGLNGKEQGQGDGHFRGGQTQSMAPLNQDQTNTNTNNVQ